MCSEDRKLQTVGEETNQTTTQERMRAGDSNALGQGRAAPYDHRARGRQGESDNGSDDDEF